PEAIFIPGYYGEVALIARQARAIGLRVPLLGGDGWIGESLLKVGGSALEGSFLSCHFSADDQSPAIQGFVKKFKTKYDETPDDMAALGYDSVMILVDAMKRAKTTDGAKLRDQIAATRDFKGVTGTITLDEQRNAKKPAVILTVKNGSLKYVSTVQP